jgi:hypothetical protein
VQEAVIGVDPHKQVVTAVALDHRGGWLGEWRGNSSRQAIAELRAWAASLNQEAAWAIGGTTSSVDAWPWRSLAEVRAMQSMPRRSPGSCSHILTSLMPSRPPRASAAAPIGSRTDVSHVGPGLDPAALTQLGRR